VTALRTRRLAARLHLADAKIVAQRQALDAAAIVLREVSQELDAAHLAGAALVAERDRLAQEAAALRSELEMSSGPYCSSCGNAIDPDCCWCGTEAKHHRGEEHGFVPVGCDCGRDPEATDWRTIASNLRRLLWQERIAREADATEAATTYEAARAELERLAAPCCQLDRFFDRELDGAQAAAFRDHLPSCERCRQVLDGRMQEQVVVALGSPE